MNITIKKILLLFVLLNNILSFGFAYYFISLPLIIFFFLLIIILKRPDIKIIYYKTRAIKILVLFVFFAIIGYLINCFQANILRFVYSLLFTYIVPFILCFIIGILLTLFYKPSTLIKFTIISLIAIIGFGFLEFISYTLKIDIINSILCFTTGQTESFYNYKLGNIPRIQSFFSEPSHYAWFLVCNIPIVFHIFKTKYRIFKNKWLNKIIKKSLLPLLLLSLFLTSSAINIIFAIIILLYIVYNSLIIKKNNILTMFGLIVVLSIIISLVSIMHNIDTVGIPIIDRTIKTVQTILSFDVFIIAEPSLATRIISYVNMAIIFLKHPLCGISCGQLALAFQHQLSYSPLPLTAELTRNMLARTPAHANPAIFYKIAVDMGVLGLFCFYYLIFNLINNFKKMITLHDTFLIKEYIMMIRQTLLVYLVLSIYDSQINCHYFWILFGIGYGIYLKFYKKQVKDTL